LRPTWLIPLVLAFNVPFAHAQWGIAIADAPATVIRGTSVYSAGVTQRLAADDMIEAGATGILLLQDDTGDVLALGPGTRILIGSNAQVSLLSGWVKIAHRCRAAPCAGPAVETERGTLDIGDHGAAIVAVVSTPEPLSEAFSESGSQKLNVRAGGTATPSSLVVAEGQFVSIASNAPAALKPRPSPAFLAGMPIPFQDALMPVTVPGALHDTLPAPLRPVSFDDVSAWLTSALPERNQPATRFVDRFRPRLADAAFEQHVQQNLSVLPEWQAVEPAPKVDVKLAEKSPVVKARPGGATERVGQSKSEASGGNAAGAPQDSGNWLTRLFGGLRK
jgi:hypothetical protein